MDCRTTIRAFLAVLSVALTCLAEVDVPIQSHWSGGFSGTACLPITHNFNDWRVNLMFDQPINSLDVWTVKVSDTWPNKTLYELAPTAMTPALKVGTPLCIAFNGHGNGDINPKVKAFLVGLPGTPSSMSGITTDAMTNVGTTAAGDTTTVCSFNPCINGGSCLLKSGSYACLCPNGFGGVVCEQVVAPTFPPCGFNPCLNGGTCEQRDKYLCVCPPTHTGIVCQDEMITTTAKPTIASHSCRHPVNTVTIENLGCQPTEIVFLLEYGALEAKDDIDKEGDFINSMIGHWSVNDLGVRIGVVTYHDSVQETIHLGRYSNTNELKSRISQLTRILQRTGEPDLSSALNFAQQTSFKGARHRVPLVVIPIIHRSASDDDKTHDIVSAAQALKNDCVTIMPLVVSGAGYNTSIVEQVATQPPHGHLKVFSDFSSLKSFGRHFKQNCPANPLVG